ncbi:MAG: prepilin-type N-terminal cleavage/methylation domain-containing protein [Planctomycetota bacterium]
MAVRVSSQLHRGRSHGFGLLELVVILVILAVVVAILLPLLGARRRGGVPSEFRHPTKIRGIHQASVMWAQDNGGFYPGLNATAEVLPAEAIEGADVPGSHPAARYVLLMNGNYFNGRFAISPVESGKTEWTTTSIPITPKNFSFAMLAIDLDDDGLSDRFPDAESFGAVEPEASDDSGEPEQPRLNHRAAEWSETLNTDAPMLGDRNIGSDADADIGSIHGGSDRGAWRGSVVYNDNHVIFETTPSHTTRFADGPVVNDDNLFAADTPGAASDAAWVFHDASSLVDQK